MIYYLSLKKDTPKTGFWDYAFLGELFRDTYNSVEVDTLPVGGCGVVVIPARSHIDLVQEINKEINKLDGVVLFLMGDEESLFPIEKIKHPNIVIYAQNCRPGRHDDYRKLGTGITPHVLKRSKGPLPEKDKDLYFSGQLTHSRRRDMAEALNRWSESSVNSGEAMYSKGFTEGVPQDEYADNLSRAKVAPCPSGPQTPDTFRFFEALAMGCIPIADNETPDHDWTGFWEWLFSDSLPIPFPTINDYVSLPGYIEESLKQYPRLNNRIQAWYLRYVNQLRRNFIEDFKKVGGLEPKTTSNITAIVPISPISSHPNIDIVLETIKSIRAQDPYCEIILTFDGVRKEQEGMRAAYEEGIRRLLWEIKGDKIIPFIFDEHKHQVGMARDIIDYVKTPVILYMEQDTPLVLDYKIPMRELSNKIISGESNLIRFHFEAQVPEPHKHMMIGEAENELLKTVQWSQRPHLASTAFYKRILSGNFSSKANCFIEDLMHGAVYNDFLKYGEQGWNQWRLHIYHPEGNIKRSYHTDGRSGEAKFDNTQKW